jgi:hypothetical protein
MGGDSYTLIHEESNWKKIRWAKPDYKWAGILVGMVGTFAIVNSRYKDIRKERSIDHDRSIFAIKSSFGTIPADQVAFHERYYGKTKIQ